MEQEQDPRDGRYLWLARFRVAMIDPAEELRSYLIAAPDRIAAEARLMDYLKPVTPRELTLGEYIDDIARVWGRDGQAFDGHIVQG